MKYYIKYISETYFELIETSDDVEATTIPAGFKPLLLLDDGTPNPIDGINYLKLIINDDVVYYKYYQECSEISDSNVKIIDMADGNLFGFDVGGCTDLPTEIIQASALCFFGADTDTIINEWQNKGFNNEYRQKVSDILDAQKNAGLITNNKEAVEAYMNLNLSSDAYKNAKGWIDKVNKPGYISTFLQNMYNKENGLPTLETSETVEAVTTEETATDQTAISS
jgi:hypothetical protein